MTDDELETEFLRVRMLIGDTISATDCEVAAGLDLIRNGERTTEDGLIEIICMLHASKQRAEDELLWRRQAGGL